MNVLPAAALARTALAVAAFGLFALPAAPLARLLQAACGGGADPRAAQEVAIGAFGIACLLVVGLALLRRPVANWRPAAPVAVLARYLPFLLVWALLLVAYLEVMHRTGSPVPRQPMLAYLQEGEPARPGFWVVLATVTFLGPLAEEVLFRGFVQDLADALLAPRPALFVTAAVFGAVHGAAYALPIFALGLLFGWLRRRHGSLLAPFVAHMVHNAITVAVACAWPGLLDRLYPQ